MHETCLTCKFVLECNALMEEWCYYEESDINAEGRNVTLQDKTFFDETLWESLAAELD